MVKNPKVFISYSWDSERHQEWVKKLATRLREDGINTILDQWHTFPGDHLPSFMEASMKDSDFVLIICTPLYRKKSARKTGGVRYEGDIITSDLFVNRNQKKFIPVLRAGQWGQASPVWLLGKYYIDLRGDNYSEANYLDLLTTLRGERPGPPPIGSNVVVDVTAKEMNKERGTEFLETELSKIVKSLSYVKRKYTAIAVLDIDDLTLINKVFGRNVGDEVLSIVARTIKVTQHPRFFGRCGDDTFYAVLTDLTETKKANIWQLCDEVRLDIETYPWNRVISDLYVTCSIGYAIPRNAGEQPNAWIIRAIQGMLEAKRQGGNKVVEGPKFAGKGSIATKLTPPPPMSQEQTPSKDKKVNEVKTEEEMPLNLRKYFS